MNKRLSVLLSSALGIGLFVIVVWLVGLNDIIARFKSLDPRLFLVFMALSFFNRALGCYRWKVILDSLGHTISYLNLLWYNFTGFCFGYVLPSAQMGGEPIRALLLKRHNVDFPEALSSVVIDGSVALGTNVIIISAGFILLLLSYPLSLKFRFLLFIPAALLVAALGVYYSRILRGRAFFTPLLRAFGFTRTAVLNHIFQKVAQMEQHVIEFFRNKQQALLEVVLLSTVGTALAFIEFWLALMLVGYTPTLLETILVTATQAVVYLFPVSGSMGVQEAGQATLGIIAGFTSSVGVALSLVIRARDIIWACVGSTFLICHGPSTAKELVKSYLKDRKMIGRAADSPEEVSSD